MYIDRFIKEIISRGKYVCVSTLVSVSSAFFYKTELSELLLTPFIDIFSVDNILTTKPTGMLLNQLLLAFLVGVLFLIIFLIINIFNFFVPSMYKEEIVFILSILMFTVVQIVLSFSSLLNNLEYVLKLFVKMGWSEGYAQKLYHIRFDITITNYFYGLFLLSIVVSALILVISLSLYGLFVVRFHKLIVFYSRAFFFLFVISLAVVAVPSDPLLHFVFILSGALLYELMLLFWVILKNYCSRCGRVA